MRLDQILDDFLNNHGTFEEINNIENYVFPAEKIPFIENFYCDDTMILIYLSNGLTLKNWHDQDCCEEVYLLEHEKIQEELEKSIGEEVVSFDITYDSNYDFTFSFANLRTNKDCYQFRWQGTSNGYYSEKSMWSVICSVYRN